MKNTHLMATLRQKGISKRALYTPSSVEFRFQDLDLDLKWNLNMNIAGLAPRQQPLMLRGCCGANAIKQR